MGNGICLIGFGEAGYTFARAAGWGAKACAFDIDDARRGAMDSIGVNAASSAAEAIEGAFLVLSLVTADSALAAAQTAAPLLKTDALFCDCNSVAPETKRKAAAAIDGGAGRYVDVAVLAPVEPARTAVPLLVSGPAAAEAAEALTGAGFTNVRVVGEEIGRASSIKLVRSIMVKGIEALTAEMMIAAHVAGVTEEVLASLDASERKMTWAERADYNLDRMMVHGGRRSAEMYEASVMLRDLGISPMMTDGTVQWQEGLGRLGISAPPSGYDAKITAITETPEFRNEI
ncbi:DUF1932 domain-containing protein [Croceicoccus bisphenolivorans]|uniref:DUF1932 domain-containing protein n=1 Tax=Croceicoccus bisphenolivorans TaxID=1783232 RepID=UPI00082A8B22|nr:NAD(P)-dependent oxidoreductase [Croceicoccus bisphenolivorans]